MRAFAIVGGVNEKVVIEIACVDCHKPNHLTISTDQALELLHPGRRNIQEVLPDVPSAQRELLISGICGDCWKELFLQEEDED